MFFKDYLKVFRTVHNTIEGKWAQLAAPQSQNWDGKEVFLFSWI